MALKNLGGIAIVLRTGRSSNLIISHQPSRPVLDSLKEVLHQALTGFETDAQPIALRLRQLNDDDKHLQHNRLLGKTWFHSIVWFERGLHVLFSFCLDIVLSLPQPAFSPFHVGGVPYHLRSCIGCVVHRQS